MKVTFYGRLADAIGPEVDLQADPGLSIAEVRRLLMADHAAAAATLASSRSMACVGGSIVGDEHVIAEGEQVAFLPPVSGG